MRTPRGSPAGSRIGRRVRGSARGTGLCYETSRNTSFGENAQVFDAGGGRRCEQARHSRWWLRGRHSGGLHDGDLVTALAWVRDLGTLADCSGLRQIPLEVSHTHLQCVRGGRGRGEETWAHLGRSPLPARGQALDGGQRARTIPSASAAVRRWGTDLPAAQTSAMGWRPRHSASSTAPRRRLRKAPLATPGDLPVRPRPNAMT